MSRIYEIVRGLVDERRRQRSSKYKRFFNTVLSKYGVSSPEELDPVKKKGFYKYVDAEWKRFKSTIQNTGE